MPTFKGKDGKPRFSMNPQVGKARYGDSIPGLETVGEHDGTAPARDLDDNGESDLSPSFEIHHGGHPEGDPEPHEGTAYHTIHKDADGTPKEIRNHDDYEGAEAHARECMAEPEHDNGDSDMMEPSGGESEVFE